jgi:hypothetical protein
MMASDVHKSTLYSTYDEKWRWAMVFVVILIRMLAWMRTYLL